MAAAKKTTAKKTGKKVATKKTGKKVAAKKIVARKAPGTKRRAKKHSALDLKPIKSKMTRAQLFQHIADQTEVDRRSVKSVLEALVQTIKASVMPKSVGQIQIPGIINVRTKKVPAKKMAAIKKGTLVRRPGSSEPVEHPGRKAFIKPATVRVRAVSMGSLKRAALGTE